jgi:TonB family protein
LKKNLVSVSRKETVQQTPHAIQKNKIAILSCNADICPQPIGGIEAIKKNLVVPHKVKQLKLEGDVVVLTTIDEFGNVRDTHVIQKLGHGCDEAAEVAILDTRFKPGKKNGRRTRCNVKILIPFSYRE